PLGEELSAVDFFEQGKSCKACDFQAYKGDILLRSSVLYCIDEFRNCIIKFMFSFFSFNTIVQNDLDIVLPKYSCCYGSLFNGFTSAKLLKNGFTYNGFHG